MRKKDSEVELEKTLDSVIKLEEYFRKQSNKTVILFADLANSTLYKQQRSFIMGLNKTRVHNNIITDIISKHKGKVVKYIGDAVLARFDIGKTEHKAFYAVNAAIKMQEKFSELNGKITDELERIETKIGIACGIIANFYGNDPQGPVVDLAARIESYAKPSQILVHQPLIDTCHLNKLKSKVGIINNWKEQDYIGKPLRLHLKGIPEPQNIVEIRWSEEFFGIKEDEKYDEYWENYLYDATVLPLNKNYPKELHDRYFNIIFDLRYQTVLTKKLFHFVCVDSIQEFNRAMKDNLIFSSYILPKRTLIEKNINDIFHVEFFQINDIRLSEISRKTPNKYYYFCSTWGNEQINGLIGQKVSIHYRISTVIAKRGNFFAMMTEYPVKDLSMKMDMSNVEIRKLSPIDFFMTKKRPDFLNTPKISNAKKIEVKINDWIYPRAGVVFVWDISDKEKALPPL